jgi:hypothetical protein
MKICKECGEPKERSEFHKHAGSADGLQAKCKVCRHAASAVYRSTRKAEIQQRDAAYYYANREKISERDKRRNALPHRRAAHALASRRYQEANRLKLQAQQMVHKALRDGALVKPKVCSRCPETSRIEAHHEDYTRPLEVWWLCYRCHKQRTKELREQEKAIIA